MSEPPQGPPQDPEEQPAREEVVDSLPKPVAVEYEADESQRPPTQEERKEQVRGQLTGWTMFTFIMTIFLGFVGVFVGRWEETEGLLKIIIPLEATLIGGIAGYYLGTGRQV